MGRFIEDPKDPIDAAGTRLLRAYETELRDLMARAHDDDKLLKDMLILSTTVCTNIAIASARNMSFKMPGVPLQSILGQLSAMYRKGIHEAQSAFQDDQSAGLMGVVRVEKGTGKVSPVDFRDHLKGGA